MSAAVQQCFKRVEKKYLLTPQQYKILCQGLRPYMKADEHGEYTICNLYYDTTDFELIRTSLEKPVYKEKLRLRSYGVPRSSTPVFAEIKKKYKGVVYKRREVLPCGQAMEYLSGMPCPRDSQILREISWMLHTRELAPRVFIGYDRTALAGIDNPALRITFDTGLRWRIGQLDLRNGDYGMPLLSSDAILMEIKIPGSAPLWLSRLLSRTEVYPTSFSKYGACYQKHLARSGSLQIIHNEVKKHA